uniref:PWWP domain-containing protein n=2 Tax=Cynoglossus semilaevis TaxID=244447 RepID=A0A3P8X439_CYNSE
MEPVADNNPSIEQEMSTPPPHSWAPKPPPLFQEGAPYPPPLLIRDTYNQALPQPLPRKIKRPKRRYRCEEPTSIMNAIKLRPRQVLCDKCKGVVSSVAHRDARRGPVDLRADEPSRRRKAVDGPISTEVKRLRNDDRGRGITDRRAPSGICLSSSSTSRRVLRGTVSSSSSRHTSLKLNSRKPLDKSNPSESSKVSVIKLARSPQKLATHQHNQDHTRVVTRAATSQNHNQKVHFTRRLQQLSSSPGASNSSHTVALPPRMRLKPQRYRTEESQAPSSCSSFLTRHITRSSPPKPFSSPALTSDPDPTTEFLSCDPHVEVLPHREVGADGPPSSLCLDSSRSECSTTGTPEALPPENPSSLPPPQSPLSSSSFLVPEGHTSCPLTPRSHSKELQAPGEEDEEEGGELKRRRKSSTSSSSSSSSSSSVFSKSVSKCALPDGRTVCVGDIVWAKIYGFPWWPARVLGITVARRGDTGLDVRQEARVSWFGSPTTSFLPLSQLSPFLETFQSRFDRKRKGPYRRAIAEAASAAKQLTPEVRALLTQFET